jgi:hypothetical protein
LRDLLTDFALVAVFSPSLRSSQVFGASHALYENAAARPRVDLRVKMSTQNSDVAEIFKKVADLLEIQVES